MALALAAAGCGGTSEPAPPLRVLTFNLRYGTAADGDDSWEHRTELVADTVRLADAHLIALQEALDFQLAFLLERFPRYQAVGDYRERGPDGSGRGEWTGLLADRERLQVLGHEAFWLSESPQEPGSVGWDAALPRIAVQAHFGDRANGGEFEVLATHMDHRGAEARLQGARMIAARAAAAPRPVIVLGDLNAGETEPPLAALADAGLVDCFRVWNPEGPESGTFHGFSGKAGQRKIDFVLVGPGWEVLGAAIVRFAASGRYPSDHFPVSAALRRAASGG